MIALSPILSEILRRYACISVVLLVLTLVLGWVQYYWDTARNLLHIPGPPPLPFVGNALKFAKSPELFMNTVKELCLQYGPVVRIHLGSRPNALFHTPEAFEKILSSNKQITKGRDYDFLIGWLGRGLLTSTGAKWHSRRKMLTPAFHFKILEDFMEVMNYQADILCKILETKAAGGKDFNVYPLVARCALDIICETAMGQSINAQGDEDSEYVKAVYLASDHVFKRQTSPWLWSDWVFSLTNQGRENAKCLSILHGFTNQVIRERKQELAEEDKVQALDESFNRKKVAFLDLLISESKGGTLLSDEDIREEVDTFMFEGHDTGAANMTFSLHLLATHPEVQTRCHQELDNIFQGSERFASSADLANMKYLESCIKESLRMYPSVPIISRTTGEAIEVHGLTIPANTNVLLLNFMLHRDPLLFPNPDKFDPDRFSAVSADTNRRHPYAYVPFSAGPRNCIGQKFAMMEEKILVSSVLRKFNLKATTQTENIPLMAELILRPQNGLYISLCKRE